ncbi:MAG: MMPL family transporter, partial [Acetatifactor sp.]|nr:MMPL family transporter [Acetatifactor sp.]
GSERCIRDRKESGNITLEDDLEETLTDAYSQISIAKDQLLGEDCSRFVLELSVPVEGEETYAALERIRSTVARYYNYEDIYLVGNSTSDKDLSTSFGMDNTIITVLTALFVMIILLFTFQSAGLPVLLVLTIQGSIWMNFSLPYLQSEPVYFLGYLVVSAIQMGATIDYAIVITSRYMELKTYMPIREAIVETLNQAFPTIVTSGSMLVAAGFIISNVSSNAVVAAIGLALGRGTLTSIALVLLALPQTLLIGDIIIEKTAFTLKRDLVKPLPSGGRIRMNGHIKGYVNGVLDGEFFGVIDGEMGAVIRAKDTVENLGPEEQDTLVPELEAVEEIADSPVEKNGRVGETAESPGVVLSKTGQDSGNAGQADSREPGGPAGSPVAETMPGQADDREPGGPAGSPVAETTSGQSTEAGDRTDSRQSRKPSSGKEKRKSHRRPRQYKGKNEAVSENEEAGGDRS